MIIAGTTIGLLVVAFFQLRTYRRQADILEAQQQTFNRQAETAEKQTEIAGSQTAIMQAQSETAEQQHKLAKWVLTHEQVADRAWVSLETLEIETFGYVKIIVIGLKNSGRTPARIANANITIRGWIRYPDADGGGFIGSTTLPDDPVNDSGEFTPPAILVAGEMSRWRHLVSYTDRPEQLSLLSVRPDLNCKLWIYGYIKYTEQFHPGTIRTYRWAREYDPILSKNRETSQGNSPMQFAHLAKPKYNEAD